MTDASMSPDDIVNLARSLDALNPEQKALMAAVVTMADAFAEAAAATAPGNEHVVPVKYEFPDPPISQQFATAFTPGRVKIRTTNGGKAVVFKISRA